MYETHGPVLDALRLRGFDLTSIVDAMDSADETGRPLRDVLVDQGTVTETELADVMADAYGIASVDLAGFQIDPAAVGRIPLALSRRHHVLAIAVEDDELVLAVADPGDVLALDDVRAATGMRVRPVAVARDELLKVLDRYQRAETDLDEVVSTEDDEKLDVVTGGDADEAPIVRYVNSLIEQAIQNRASDMHLEPTATDLRVRFRIDGVLHEIDTVPRSAQSALISRLKIMSAVDITERRVPQNGRITMDLGGRSVDLRVATLPTVWGEKIVLRVLDTGGVDLDLARLGFTDGNYERFTGALRKPHGMVLVTGPTGSGKSTTLYAALTAISSAEVNVITVEDPVEYRLPGVNQVQVNHKAGLTFAAVLPAILRSDPDVVLIGEIRDRVTAQLAIEASLTGHLVLSTLHTNDAPSAVTRLIEMGIEPFLVGSSLDCVMAQRLARRLCQWCKEAYAPSDTELAAARWPQQLLEVPDKLWRPVGCRSCAQTGYRGRIALHEVMPVTEQIERQAVDRLSAHDIQRTALEQGMWLLRYDGLRKAALGDTSLAEVLRVAV
ncbi:type IV pilus assembly protein PilB [Jatrophihabitans endophyticus]|uniref:Type IV pilus assembly protein PilB n=1 Tax=Jatrophihabitans endophyticus TaxID=1206085 RepID=A0A1M5UGC7_9ACTN|nr:GspE/PulE family protein [Jatrophihabitans endophyticus]SHH61876.1 type IV pilus assembly protein PilB [Jatrophihabitans endophyticus]